MLQHLHGMVQMCQARFISQLKHFMQLRTSFSRHLREWTSVHGHSHLSGRGRLEIKQNRVKFALKIYSDTI